MKAVILSGGKGARLAPYSKLLPKPLMPIGDKPILEIILRQMKQAGVDEVILAVGQMSAALEAYFSNGSRFDFDIKISYSAEEQPLGTIGPLSLITGIEESFLVTNCDVLTTLDFAALVRYHQLNQAAATIAMHSRQVRLDLGVLALRDGSNEIIGYSEKPTYTYPISMGIYVFDPGVLHYIPKNQHYDFPELVLQLVAAGEKVVGYSFVGYWQDLGKPEDYERAISDYSSNQFQFLGENQ